MVKVNSGRRASWMPLDASEKFFYKGYKFPVCARCTDVIVSSFLAFLFLLKRSHQRNYVYLCLELCFLIGLYNI